MFFINGIWCITCQWCNMYFRDNVFLSLCRLMHDISNYHILFKYMSSLVNWYVWLLTVGIYLAARVSLLPTCLPHTAGVYVDALGNNIHTFPKDLIRSLTAYGFNLRPTLRSEAVLSFYPETNTPLLNIVLELKRFVPFFTGQRRGTWRHRRKEIIIGLYRSRSCATAADSLRGRNKGPQTWNLTPRKCLRSTQEKLPQRLV